VSKLLRRMLRDGGRIGEGSPPEALHDLRKQGKELRYLLELFGPVFPPRAVEPLVGDLKQLQKVLGRFQDRAVQAETLRALAADHDGAAAPGALEAVLAGLRADQDAARAEFAAAFAAFERAAARKRVVRAFGDAAGG
jgi:CHAD domain-containing protein